MKKIKLFLDIDGVLNNTNDNKKVYNYYKKNNLKSEYMAGVKVFEFNENKPTFDFVNIQKLKQLNNVLKNFDVDVYIISSWCQSGYMSNDYKKKYSDFFNMNVLNSIEYTIGCGRTRFQYAQEFINDGDIVLYLDDTKIPKDIIIPNNFIVPNINRGLSKYNIKYIKRMIYKYMK